MPVTGIIPLSLAQAAIESTKGTILPATRKQPILDGFLQEMVDRVKVVEQRNSLIRNYRSHQIRRWVEISGMTVQPTYEDLPWFLQAFLKGGVTATTDGGSPPAYPYIFTPTATSDDLKTVNWEFGTDTQDFSVPYCVGNRIQLGFNTDGPMTMQVDYLGQRAVKQTRTAALSDRVTEDIIGIDGIVYIDDTTIGTTAAAYPLSMQVTIDNNYQHLWTLGGTKYPSEAYRGEQRMMACEMVLAFASITEFDKFVTSPAERKIRYRVEGSTIHTTVKKRLTVDWYGYWDEASFGEQNGLRTLTMRGESHYNVSAGHDWRVEVVNALSSLP